MRIRNVKNAKEIIENSNYIIDNYRDYRGRFKDVFHNNKPIYLEIGMGKGDFLIGMAKKYLDINFIGVEKYDSIVAKALLKLKDCNIPNLKIIVIDALELDEVFDKEISRLYLNFSDPWPKKRHAKRRLTSPIFLKIYEKIFAKEIVIEQKTDNIHLLESSIINFSENGYIIKEISLDWDSNLNGGVETEYERKFKEMGVAVNYLRVEKKMNK